MKFDPENFLKELLDKAPLFFAMGFLKYLLKKGKSFIESILQKPVKQQLLTLLKKTGKMIPTEEEIRANYSFFFYPFVAFLVFASVFLLLAGLYLGTMHSLIYKSTAAPIIILLTLLCASGYSSWLAGAIYKDFIKVR